ncbi:methylthioribose-1-phosphate isomerase-like [Oppia nitens]|uniref:methylthioribose-1-phosphate isomerase-like n=1 Tax=Oppia nitens TaxID=1686743 RepID=UPI0023DB81C5|nr:methylthioribose-1-phosphate isomerase-like [Oppia nitens]
MVESIIFSKNKLKILNQLKLPLQVEYEDINNVTDAWNAIHSMKVRGAPAIAILAVLSVAVELNDRQLISPFNDNKELLLSRLRDQCTYLCTSRPTAVNIDKECKQLVQLALKLSTDSNVSFEAMVNQLTEYSVNLLQIDINTNKAIGDFGAKHIKSLANKESVTILTHCNTGSLATAGYGTALGVIRSLHLTNSLTHAYCTETRPYNQGSRLTAWELLTDKIPSTLICDNMVAALFKNKTVDAVVVGADRVVANGDTANKIGTYQIAVLAKYHSVPFFVASPLSTIDMSKQSGNEIPIEERPADEIKKIGGIQITAADIKCWNPSFDVTPNELITGIITELGVFAPNELKTKIN